MVSNFFFHILAGFWVLILSEIVVFFAGIINFFPFNLIFYFALAVLHSYALLIRTLTFSGNHVPIDEHFEKIYKKIK